MESSWWVYCLGEIGLAHHLVPCPLFVRLSSVAFLAQHLAVACYRPPAFRPRRDMVGVHLLYLEVPSAGGADALLPLIHLAPRVAVERADAEAMRT